MEPKKLAHHLPFFEKGMHIESMDCPCEPRILPILEVVMHNLFFPDRKQPIES